MGKITFNKKQQAQTAIELAVFGVILISVLGSIIRQATSGSYAQNQALRAMRLAMTMSFQCSHGMFGCYPANTSRNTASVVFIEDRLVPGAGKYGAIDRIPLVFSGGGAHSKQFFQPVEDGEKYNLPVFDMFINGQHFAFKTAGFKTINLDQASVNGGSPYVEWDPNCIGITTSGVSTVSYQGCAYSYTRVINTPQSSEWCDDIGVACTENLPVDERFDLNLDGAFPDVTNDGNFPDQNEFSWQWLRVYAFDLKTAKKKDFMIGVQTTFNLTNPWEDAGIHLDQNYHTSLDLDGDSKEERIVKITNTAAPAIITQVRVIDSQDGDIDFTFDDRDSGTRPGLQNDVQMWVLTKDGTYLQLDQGRLYTGTGDNREFYRSAQKKDQIDVIQRAILLSNDTDSFCDASGSPVAGTPIEVCNPLGNLGPNECFRLNNLTKTCMDEGPPPIIYVRSRLRDLHGRKYVTDLSQDPAFTFDPQAN